MAVRAKTHRGAVKRFRKTANGFKRKQAGHRHLFANKSRKRLRNLNKGKMVDKRDEGAIARMLGLE